jgi:hypothetical protein
MQPNTARPSGPLPTYAAMHASFWRRIAQKPAVFLLLPAVLFFPFDLLTEALTSDMGTLESIKISSRIGRVVELLVGTYAAGCAIWTMGELHAGRSPTFGASLRGGARPYNHLLRTVVATGIRIGFGLLLLIVPGLVLATRYALATPHSVFAGVYGIDAGKASRAMVEGRFWRTFGAMGGSILLYVPLFLALTTLISWPAPDNLIVSALGSAPLNAAGTLLAAGAAHL